MYSLLTRSDAISSADPPVWIDPSIAIDSQSFAFYAPVWNVYREIPTTQVFIYPLTPHPLEHYNPIHACPNSIRSSSSLHSSKS